MFFATEGLVCGGCTTEGFGAQWVLRLSCLQKCQAFPHGLNELVLFDESDNPFCCFGGTLLVGLDNEIRFFGTFVRGGYAGKLLDQTGRRLILLKDIP